MTNHIPPKTPIGVLIANTGTPDSPNPQDIATFLEDMLLDKHLVSCPHFIWKPILKCFILPNRPKKTQGRYQQIWTDEGSPFVITTKAQQRALEVELENRGLAARVAFGMRYGNPSIASALDELIAKGCTTIVLAPLYPQSANVTTVTTIENFNHAVENLSPNIRSGLTCLHIECYCEQEKYLEALACSIKERWEWKPGSRILFSYHSTLVEDIKKGDPYYRHTLSTSRGVAQLLGIPEDGWSCAYHSRFDSRKWLKPPAEEVLEKWAHEGVSDVAVIAPVFTSDCIETLVDIKIEQKEFYLERFRHYNPRKEPANFIYIPTLGARQDHIEVIADMVETQLFVRNARR